MVQTTFGNYKQVKKNLVKEKKDSVKEKRASEREVDRFFSEQKKATQTLVKSKPKDKEKLEKIITDFSKGYDKGLVFYSWIQAPLKREFGKNYKYEYMSYCVDKLKKKGYQFTMD